MVPRGRRAVIEQAIASAWSRERIVRELAVTEAEIDVVWSVMESLAVEREQVGRGSHGRVRAVS